MSNEQARSELVKQLKTLEDTIGLLIDFIESGDCEKATGEKAADGKAADEKTESKKNKSSKSSKTTEAEPDPAPAPLAPEVQAVTYEEARSILAKKAQAGFKAEIKAELRQLGASTLSELKDDPEKLAALVEATSAFNAEGQVSTNG